MNKPPNTHPIRSQYEDFMRHVDTHGVFKADRTGTGTKSVFGYQKIGRASCRERVLVAV